MKVATKYAKSGNINIAYQLVGRGKSDIVIVQGWVSHLELMWEEPEFARFLQGLSTAGRLIVIDKRGTGLSDRVPVDQLPSFEQRMDDVRAVMDAVGVGKAVIIGFSEGAPLAALFAAAYPDRCESLIMVGGYASRIWSEEYPWAPTPEEREKFYQQIEQGWGGIMDLSKLAPSKLGDIQFEEWWVKYLRASASPGAALALARMNTAIDIRPVLRNIKVPTLVLHRKEDKEMDIGGAQYIAQRIPNARLVELPGQDHLPYINGQQILAEIIQFITGKSITGMPDRVVKTVLFTDIVDSTQHALLLGDAKWRDLLGEHDLLVRKALKQFQGEEIDSAGDGFFAVFDSPVMGVIGASKIVRTAQNIGLQLRAGVHTGECVYYGTTFAGVTLHIGARLSARAEPNEVLVTLVVKEELKDTGITLEPKGKHTLKGIPMEMELFSVDHVSAFLYEEKNLEQ